MRSAARRAQDREPIGDEVRALAGVEKDPEGQRVQRPDLDRRGCRHARAEPPLHSRREIAGRRAVERDDADPVGRNTAIQQDGQARDHRRGLAAPGRRDDLRRTVG